MSFFRDQWNQIRGNLKYDLGKTLIRWVMRGIIALLVPSAYEFISVLKHVHWDGYIFAVLFVTSFAVLVITSRRSETAAVIVDATTASVPKYETPSLSDPLIRVEVISQTRERFYKDTKFILYNDHESTAYSVKIQDADLSSVKVGKATAEFDLIETIPGKSQRATLSKITSNTPIFWADFTPYLEWKIEEDPKVLAEICVPMLVRYTDYTKKSQLETAFDLIFIPRRDVSREEKQRWEKDNINPPFEVRNIEFRKLKTT